MSTTPSPAPRRRRAAVTLLALAAAAAMFLVTVRLASPAPSGTHAVLTAAFRSGTSPGSGPGNGLLGPLTGTDQNGVPLSHYDISGNDENGWDVPAMIMLFITNGWFTLARVLVGAQVWLLNWAFSFGAAKALLSPAQTIATTYQTQVIGRLGLAGTLLTFAAFWCGVMILRGRTSRGAGELAVSVLIAALAGTLLASPATLLLGSNGLLGQTRDTAMSLASVVATAGHSDTPDPATAAAPLDSTLISTFVVQPYQLLNFGTLIDSPDVPAACRAAYTQIVNGGPWGDAGTPRNLMAGAGCQDLANYDANVTWDRLMGAFLLFVAVLVVTVLVVLVTGTLLIAQFSFAAYAIACPLVVTVAVLPGGARGLLWRWLGGIAKVALAIIAIVMFIPLFATFIRALLTATSSEPLAARFFLLDLAAVAGLVYHRRLMNAGIRAGHRIGRRLELARTGGTRGLGRGLGGGSSGGGYGGYGLNAGWLGAGTPSALAPVSLNEIRRGARAEVARVTDPARRAARQARRAWTGQRRPPAKDATGLQARLSTTRGGRTVLRAGKTAAVAGKIAFGSTIGAPVMVPRAATAARAAARARSTAMRAKLAQSAARHGSPARQFGQEWAKNTGMSAATRAVKNSTPAVVLGATISAASPRSRRSGRPGYAASAPSVPRKQQQPAPAPQAPNATPATLPQVPRWRPPARLTAIKKAITEHNPPKPPPPQPPEPLRPSGVHQLKRLLDTQNRPAQQKPAPPAVTRITIAKAAPTKPASPRREPPRRSGQ